MTKTYLKYHSRITVLSSVVLILWAVLAGRLFQIQVVEGEVYHSRGIRQAQVRETIPATRGTIFDRNQLALTANLIHYSIGIHPNKISNANEIAELISRITGKPESIYLSRMNSSKPFIYLERNIDDPACEEIINRQIPGITVEKTVSRSYPHQNIAGQILGFINIDGKGIAGLELKYDEFLQGNSGWMVKQANGLGKTQRKASYPVQRAENGADIYLTIDIEYQAVLQEELYRRLKKTNARSATGILMNPQDGSILAMASVPDFDPGNPGNYSPEYQKNRVITDQFEPGSTYKIVCATAALDKNLVGIDREFNCEGGEYAFAGKVIKDWEQFGLLNFSQIIEQSSNVGVIKIAQEVGQKNLYRYSRDYGFGAQTNINLIGETSGILRAPDRWSEISLAEVSIGYEVGVTALQMACAYSAVANGGILMKPRIIDRIVAADGSTVYHDNPEVIRKVAAKEVMYELTGMLVRAVENGTGEKAHIPGWTIAGKTGTAQKYVEGGYSNKKYISNFAGFFPAENPQVVGVFVLDEPQYGYHWGGYGAAPLFRQVAERIINLDDNLLLACNQKLQQTEVSEPPLVPEEPQEHNYVSLSTVALSEPPSGMDGICTVPDICGMSLKKALMMIASAGLKPKFEGSGVVAWQSPRPGTVVQPNSVCIIGLR